MDSKTKNKILRLVLSRAKKDNQVRLETSSKEQDAKSVAVLLKNL